MFARQYARIVPPRVMTNSLGQSKDSIIGICCFSPRHAALRRKSKDCLSRNQNNMSEGSDMSTCGQLFQCVGLVQGVHLHHLIDSCDNLKYESTDYVQVIILKPHFFVIYKTGTNPHHIGDSLV
jgi:hypothetical protein